MCWWKRWRPWSLPSSRRAGAVARSRGKLRAAEELLRKTWRALVPWADLSEYSQEEQVLLQEICGRHVTWEL
eukprot:12930399-Prorocentrum_lima.AAC.1